MATFEEWLARYEAAYAAIPQAADAACPNCGYEGLRLAFTGDIATAIGWAAFWCDNCLQGITLSRVPIPDGAVVRDISQPPERRRPLIPDFQIVTD